MAKSCMMHRNLPGFQSWLGCSSHIWCVNNTTVCCCVALQLLKFLQSNFFNRLTFLCLYEFLEQKWKAFSQDWWK